MLFNRLKLFSILVLNLICINIAYCTNATTGNDKEAQGRILLQLIRIFNKYISDHPDESNQPAPALFVKAMKNAFSLNSCQPETETNSAR